MKIEQMDRAVVKRLADDLEVVAKAIASERGLSVRYAGGNYGSSHATLKFEFSVIGGDGVVQDRMAEDWKRMAPMFGLKAEDLAKEFRTGQATYRIVGLKPGASKYPIVAERTSDGKRFKFPVETIRMALAIPQVGVSVTQARVKRGKER